MFLRLIVIVFIWSGAYVHAFNHPIIPQHGKYSWEYQSDWSNLPKGKEYVRNNILYSLFIKGFGTDFQRKYFNKEQVHLKGIRLQVHWKNFNNKYGNTLFLIRGCDQVVVEDVAIIQLDPDYRASHSILIEDCKEVIIRKSFFAGTSNNYHIRVEGCKNVFIDNIEISGFDYGEKGIRCGGGILVNNGFKNSSTSKKKRGMYSPNPKDLSWCVIQNCYVHDNLAKGNKWRNQDGILIHSPSDGIVFNCYFENWKKGDAALDVSHRREDSEYKNHLFRIERNIFKNCTLVKTPGKSVPSCKLFFANNLYINTFIADYHGGYDVYHVHESYIFNKDRSEATFFKLWGIKDGLTYFRNCLLSVFDKKFHTVYFQSSNSQQGDYRALNPDYFAYLIPKPGYWLKGKGDFILNWDDWIKDGLRDGHSLFKPPSKCFVDITKSDYRLLKKSPATGIGCKYFINIALEGMKVDKDFYGKNRRAPPSAGAFEVH